MRVCRVESYITENEQRLTLVGAVQAYDRDSGPDGLLHYAITAGNDDNYFHISGVGFGEVLIQKTPINPHTYTLTITASDRGTPPRSANATMVVHVAATSDVDCNTGRYGK